jgi:undecaprenyl-diphosphatase
MLELIQAAVMGLVEGLTEYLPISSTGHLILAGSILGFDRAAGGEEMAKAFEVIIQVGAIGAVAAAYPRRFTGFLNWRGWANFSGLRGLWLLLLTTLPAAVIGLKFEKSIKQYLFSPLPVAGALIVGSLWIFWVERKSRRYDTESLDAIGWGQALGIGCFQCFALWPGFSRSAATILGGMMVGLDRKTSTEYSFFAAVPVLTAAAGWDFYNNFHHFHTEHLPLFAIGLAVSFLSGWGAVRFLIQFLRHHTLAAFGWYRIVLAVVILGLFAASALGWIQFKVTP